MVTLGSALASGHREALVALAEQLAQDIDTVPIARDRLATVRAFLATVTALEAMDAAALRRARTDHPGPPTDPSSGTGNPVADLLAHRSARRGRAAG